MIKTILRGKVVSGTTYSAYILCYNIYIVAFLVLFSNHSALPGWLAVTEQKSFRIGGSDVVLCSGT